MKRRQIFAGNWKMHKNFAEAESLVRGLSGGIDVKDERDYIVFPPSVYLRELAGLTGGSPVKTGIQNIYFEEKGAFTGEISPDMARDCGVEYVLVGHSERRHVFGETDGDTNKKVKVVLDYGMIPVLCVGELLEEREGSKTIEVLERQLKEGFSGIDENSAAKVVLAYEPVWAIGTGRVATPEIADETHRDIRKILEKLYSVNLSQVLSILYGGSVKPDNISGLYASEDIDGVLVGGASLEIESFTAICNVNL